jgi:hypothetical protein
MLAEELAELKHALSTGRWGFRAPLLIAVGQPLVTSMVPAYLARVWTVTLTAWRYQTGIIGVAALPPDNNTSAGPGLVAVKVEWGIDGGNETCLVDYPWSGVTFQLHAAYVRVSLEATASPSFTAPPIVGAMLSPSGRLSQPREGPTYTTGQHNILAAGTGQFPVPARARAYRLVPQNGATAADATGVSQFDVGGGVRAIDIPPAAANKQRSDWVPLSPSVEGLVITTVPALSFYIEWLLDLG